MENFFKKNRLSFALFFGNLYCLCFILTILNYLSISSFSTFADSHWLISFDIIFFFAWLFFFSKQNAGIIHKKIKTIFKVGFYFFTIAIIAKNCLEFIKNSHILKITTLLEQNYEYLLILFIIFGLFTFYFKNNTTNKKSDIEITDNDRIKQSFDNKKIKNKSIIIISLIFITITGIYVRIKNLGLPSFWNDEVVLVLVTKNFLSGSGMTLPSGNNYFFSLPSIFILSLSFLLNKVSELTARIPFAIIGSLTIPVNYIVVKKIFNSKKIALLTAVGVCLSLWLINYSREIRFYALTILLVHLIIIYLYNFTYQKNNLNLILLIAATSLSVINHQLLSVILPFVFFVVCLNIYKTRDSMSKIKRNSILISFVLMILILFFFFHETVIYFLFKAIRYSFLDNGVLFYVKLFYNNFLFLSLLFLISPLLALRDNKKTKNISIALFIFVMYSFFVMSFVLVTKVERYIIYTYPVVLILGIRNLYLLTSSSTNKKKLAFLITLILILTSISSIRDAFLLPSSKIAYNSSLQKNRYSWREASAYLNNETNDKEKGGIIITGNGLISGYYGVNANYTIKRKVSKIYFNAAGVEVDYYDGLPFANTIEFNKLNDKVYLILDTNQYKDDAFINFIKNNNLEQIYKKEGVMLFSNNTN